MPISIARKFQALRDLHFSDVHFEVRPLALTVDQVRDLGLPSTPLKSQEKRADRWRAAFGVEQTEIDALATLQPRVLEQIITESIEPFYDTSLEDRVAEAKGEWQVIAQEWLTDQLDGDVLDEIRAEAEVKLDAMRELSEQIDALNEQLRMTAGGRVSLPPVEIPEAVIDPALHGKPLISCSWSWVDQTLALKARKAYEAF